jgi:hypothetical protein
VDRSLANGIESPPATPHTLRAATVAPLVIARVGPEETVPNTP